jgi:hypothetical protein
MKILYSIFNVKPKNACSKVGLQIVYEIILITCFFGKGSNSV